MLDAFSGRWTDDARKGVTTGLSIRQRHLFPAGPRGQGGQNGTGGVGEETHGAVGEDEVSLLLLNTHWLGFGGYSPADALLPNYFGTILNHQKE